MSAEAAGGTPAAQGPGDSGDSAPSAERDAGTPEASPSGERDREADRTEESQDGPVEETDHDSHRVGPSAEAAEATGGMGRGSQRYEYVRNAFANVQGDVVGGDKYVLLAGGSQEQLRKLTSLTRNQVADAYEEHPELGEARERLREEFLIVLRGPEGHGKKTMAARLLLDREVIFDLDRDVDLAKLAERIADNGGLTSDVGFILDRPRDLGNLAEHYESIRGVLAALRAHMVVTATSAEVGDTGLHGVVDVTVQPNLRGVVERNLAVPLGTRGARRALKTQGVSEVLEERFSQECSCAHAAALAKVIAGLYERNELSAERLEARAARIAAEDFEQWAEELESPELCAFAIALGVLNGLPYDDIVRAARLLLRALEEGGRLAREDGHAVVPRAQEPFALPRRRLQERLRAETVTQPQDGVAYGDGSYARRVVHYFWSQYQVQDVLLDWLGALVSTGSDQVRAYAGVALGALARESFSYVSAGVLNGWAHSKDARRREAAALALSVAADGSVAQTVADRAREWYADPSEPLGQATAARVYGLLNGCADEQVAALMRLAIVDRVTVAVAVGQALTDLLARDRNLVEKVLQALLTRVSDHRARAAALLVFLIVAAQWVVDADTWGDDCQAADGWPALLYLANGAEKTRYPFVALWRESLDQPVFRKEAEKVLRSWAEVAEKDSRFRQLFEYMVHALVHGSPRTGAILRECAGAWSSPNELIPLTSTRATVDTVLTKEGL